MFEKKYLYISECFAYMPVCARAIAHILLRTACNLGHIILELCNVLVEIRLTTSKTKRDI